MEAARSVDEFQKKISLLPVTYSNSILKDLNEPLGNEFLWFYGYGAVHKGLDILLDIFSEKKEYTLNIVGNIDTEKDFINIYAKELYSLPNIKYHGFLSPMSNEYKNVIKPFYRIDKSRGQNKSGVGLGLSITNNN